jgi:hypothetical protein
VAEGRHGNRASGRAELDVLITEALALALKKILVNHPHFSSTHNGGRRALGEWEHISNQR